MINSVTAYTLFVCGIDPAAVVLEIVARRANCYRHGTIVVDSVLDRVDGGDTPCISNVRPTRVFVRMTVRRATRRNTPSPRSVRERGFKDCAGLAIAGNCFPDVIIKRPPSTLVAIGRVAVCIAGDEILLRKVRRRVIFDQQVRFKGTDRRERPARTARALIANPRNLAIVAPIERRRQRLRRGNTRRARREARRLRRTRHLGRRRIAQVAERGKARGLDGHATRRRGILLERTPIDKLNRCSAILHDLQRDDVFSRRAEQIRRAPVLLTDLAERRVHPLDDPAITGRRVAFERERDRFALGHRATRDEHRRSADQPTDRREIVEHRRAKLRDALALQQQRVFDAAIRTRLLFRFELNAAIVQSRRERALERLVRAIPIWLARLLRRVGDDDLGLPRHLLRCRAHRQNRRAAGEREQDSQRDGEYKPLVPVLPSCTHCLSSVASIHEIRTNSNSTRAWYCVGICHSANVWYNRAVTVHPPIGSKPTGERMIEDGGKSASP